MCDCIVATADRCTHVTHCRTGFGCIAETATAMVMMERIAMMPIVIIRPNGVCIPPSRIIPPVPRRCPCVPRRTPEPIVDNGTINIYGLDNVVGTIDILIPHHLYRYFLLLVFLNIDRGNILIDVLCQDGLKHD